MCAVCRGTQRINGRVDHVRWNSQASPYDSASHLTPGNCWMEGIGIPCPYCQSDAYGDIKRVELRGAVQS